jgi:hypothetical protein
MSKQNKTAQAFEEQQKGKEPESDNEPKRVAALTISLYDNHRFSIEPYTSVDGEKFRADFQLIHLFASFLRKLCNQMEMGEALNNILTVEKQEVKDD